MKERTKAFARREWRREVSVVSPKLSPEPLFTAYVVLAAMTTLLSASGCGASSQDRSMPASVAAITDSVSPKPAASLHRSERDTVMAYAPGSVSWCSTLSDGYDTSPPEPLVVPTPIYPEDPRKAGIDGSVVVEAEVDTTGQVIDVSVVSSSGTAALDSCAVLAAYSAKFSPARTRSGPVPARTPIAYQFRIEVTWQRE